MFTREECRYYAPCGLCTKHDRPCKEVCKKDTYAAISEYFEIKDKEKSKTK